MGSECVISDLISLLFRAFLDSHHCRTINATWDLRLDREHFPLKFIIIVIIHISECFCDILITFSLNAGNAKPQCFEVFLIAQIMITRAVFFCQTFNLFYGVTLTLVNLARLERRNENKHEINFSKTWWFFHFLSSTRSLSQCQLIRCLATHCGICVW